MAIPKDKAQISITLPKEVLKWAELEASKTFKSRASFVSDIVIQEYLKNKGS